tara:strand:+ start:685 stop:1356 length:672 start_codon:yes stop_codon:yes gene_type:complete
MKLHKFDTEKKFEYENGFYITSDVDRVGKLLSHYKLYEMIKDLPGDIVETGVFMGASFIRWMTFRNLLENENSRTVIGFDIFGAFPDTDFEADKKYVEKFVESAGENSISVEELEKVLSHKRLTNYKLIKGNINNTLPKYFDDNPHCKIALLHIDTDVYEPAKVALEKLWSRIVKGGIVVLDDYGTFPGETLAADEFFKDKDVEISKLPISHKVPAYVVKKHT